MSEQFKAILTTIVRKRVDVRDQELGVIHLIFRSPEFVSIQNHDLIKIRGEKYWIFSDQFEKVSLVL